MMGEYQSDLVRGLLWLTGALGGVGLATIAWGIKAALARMDRQDNQLADIKDLLQSELAEIRSMHHELDVRVTRIEERCIVRNHQP